MTNNQASEIMHMRRILKKFRELPVGIKINRGVSYLNRMLLVTTVTTALLMAGVYFGFSQYRHTALDTNSFGRIQANILEARLAAYRFIRNNDPAELEEFNSRVNVFDAVFETSIEHVKDNIKATENILDIQGRKDNYVAAFKRIVDQQKVRNEIVYNELDALGPSIEVSLSEIFQLSRSGTQNLAPFEFVLAMKNLMAARTQQKVFLDLNDENSEEKVKSHLDALELNLEQLRAHVQDSRGQDLLALVVKQTSQYRSSFENLVAAIKKRNSIKKNEMDVEGPYIAAKIEEMKLANKKIQDSIGPILSSSSLLLLVLTPVFACFVFFFGRFLRVELVRANQELSDKIRHSLGSLDHSSSRIGKMVEDATQNFRQLRVAVASQSSATNETASASTENARSAERAKDLTEKSLVNSKEVRKISEQGRMNIEEVVSQMDKILESNNDVRQMAEAMMEIEAKIKLIDDIVFQTNLLSFNASVEAARAGEHGKGFSVVAEEISHLANASGKSAKEISELMVNSKTRVDSIVTANGEKVDQGRALVDKAAALIKEIGLKSQATEALCQEVLNTSSEQLHANSQIAEAMHAIQAETEKTKQIADSADEMNKLLLKQSQELTNVVTVLSELTASDEPAVQV